MPPFPIATVERLDHSVLEEEEYRVMFDYHGAFFADYLVCSNGLADLTVELGDRLVVDFSLPPKSGALVLLEEEIGQCVCVYSELNPPGFIIGVVFQHLKDPNMRPEFRLPLSMN